MAMRGRARWLRGLVKRCGLLSGGLLLALVAIGSVSARIGSDLVPEGTLVTVERTQVHLNCRGPSTQAPTLVALPGLGANSQSFHWLARLLSDKRRVCRIDPIGKGFSPESDGPRDPDTVIRQLSQALREAGVEPPYVLAGHSFGGTLAHVLAGQHPEDVAGLVLLDATHPEHLLGGTTEPGKRSLSLRIAVASVRALSVAADLGLVHLYLNAFGGLPDEGLPTAVAKVNRSFYRTGKDLRATALELEAAPQMFARAAKFLDLGDLPLLVVTAGKRTDKRRLWNHQQRELAQLSSRARHLTLRDAHHDTLLAHERHARRVASAIIGLYGMIPPTQAPRDGSSRR